MTKICPQCEISHTVSGFGKNSEFCCHACEVLYNLSDFKNTVAINFQNEQKGSKFFEQLRAPEVIESYLDPKSTEGTYKFHFFIEGLQCSSCVHLLEELPTVFDGCSSAELHFGQSKLIITLKSKEDLSQAAEVIRAMGYWPIPIRPNADNESLEEVEKKNDLKRLAVAGLCASQIMVFSFALYFGADGLYREIFKWGSLVLFLPILFYSAIPFYKGAWASLKFRQIHIDLPIVIALISTTIFSVWHFIRDDDAFYFDSTAGFLFLILLARYFVKRTQAHYLSPKTVQKHLSSKIYKMPDGSFRLADQIKVGDLVQVESGQSVPTDAILESSAGLFDTSLVNGESRPNYFAQGLPLLAGYKLLSQSAVIRATKSLPESEISLLIKSSFQNLLKKSNFISKSDDMAQRLIALVLSIGLIGFVILTPLVGIEESVRRVLALFVVACPCALAFGSPLTMALAFSKAQKLGIAIRNPNIFEKLSRIKNVFFDKTGTLTEGQLKMEHTWPEEIDLETKRLVIEMEKISLHPVAFAVRSAWENELSSFQTGSAIQKPIQFTKHTEKLGSGIRAELEDTVYEIKALPESTHDHQVAIGLFENRNPIARLYFEDPVRKESEEIVQKLKAQNKSLRILSGDRKQRAMAVANQCAIPGENVFAELYPEDKEEILSQHEDTLMIGDGLNDALALSKSDVGISMSNAHELTVHSSDVTFLRGGLQPLADLFTLQEKTLKTLNRNLKLALAYNGISGVLALMGLINPLVAAVLMPLSTGLVLVSTLWGLK